MMAKQAASCSKIHLDLAGYRSIFSTESFNTLTAAAVASIGFVVTVYLGTIIMDETVAGMN
jgi:hypothetical protein